MHRRWPLGRKTQEPGVRSWRWRRLAGPQCAEGGSDLVDGLLLLHGADNHHFKRIAGQGGFEHAGEVGPPPAARDCFGRQLVGRAGPNLGIERPQHGRRRFGPVRLIARGNRRRQPRVDVGSKTGVITESGQQLQLGLQVPGRGSAVEYESGFGGVQRHAPRLACEQAPHGLKIVFAKRADRQHGAAEGREVQVAVGHFPSAGAEAHPHLGLFRIEAGVHHLQHHAVGER